LFRNGKHGNWEQIGYKKHGLLTFDSALYTPNGFLFVFVNGYYFLLKQEDNSSFVSWNQRLEKNSRPPWNTKSSSGRISSLFYLTTPKIVAATFGDIYDWKNKLILRQLYIIVSSNGNVYHVNERYNIFKRRITGIKIERIDGAFHDLNRFYLVVGDEIWRFEYSLDRGQNYPNLLFKYKVS